MKHSRKKQNQSEQTTKTTGQTQVRSYGLLGPLHNEQPQTPQLPPRSYFGGSQQRGAHSRDSYSICSDYPIAYSPTSDDVQNTLGQYPSQIEANPIIGSYPWLNALLGDKTNATQGILSRTEPVTKCLGKGVGNVVWIRSGEGTEGQEEVAPTTLETTQIGMVLRGPIDPWTVGPVWPYNGYLYSGQLVQLTTTIDGDIIRTSVIPYQQGRGVPEYPHDYYPAGGEGLSTYPPYGQLTWPSTNSMSPSLARGVQAGDTNVCVGVVLDTQTTLVPDERLFRPQGDSGDPTYSRSAPHTLPPESTSDGFTSPGPNRSDTWYAPWPRYYAYPPNEPVPVLVEGITTLVIGACTNIALMTYGLKESVSSTGTVWVPVPCIPLFEGERVEAGSIIYASAKGHSISAGPISEYQPDTSFTADQSGLVVSVGVIGQTPWDPYVDSTWGNWGWTSTPGLAFGFIPDTTTAILETVGGSTIDYLSQANQGTVIVSAVTSVAPSPGIGNAYLQSGLELDEKGLEESEVHGIKEARHALTGISGRGNLVQVAPEGAQPVGVLLETIVGKGKWTYTAQPLGDEPDLVGELSDGGALYADPNTINPTDVTDNVGGVGGGTVEWTENLPDPPNLGTIVSPTFTNPGGYGAGDVITVTDASLTWHTQQFHGNNACYDIGAADVLTARPGGTGYTAAAAGFELYNLSRNNAYLDFSQTVNIAYEGNDPGDAYYKDYNRYSLGTVVRVLGGTGGFDSDGYFQVTTLADDSDTLGMDVLQASSSYAFAGTNYAETEQANWDTVMGRARILVNTVGANGNITDYTFDNYGAGNEEGDLLLVLGGDYNAVIQFPGMPYGEQEIIATGPSYTEAGNAYDAYVAAVLTNTANVVTDPTRDDLPIIVSMVVPPASDMYLALRYDGGYSMATPWYHGNCVFVNVTPTTSELSRLSSAPATGGTNETSYNMSANSLRVLMTVTNGVPVSVVAGTAPYDDVTGNFLFDESRYTFDPVNGTQVRVLSEAPYRVTDSPITTDDQVILRLDSFDISIGLGATIIREGGYYGLADGDYIFQTQRLDQENPKVDWYLTITNNTGQMGRIVLRTKGVNNEQGDIMLLTDSEQVNNMKFKYNNNLRKVDLPPYAKRPGYDIESDSDAWGRYAEVMKSATNLFDRQVLVELRPTPDDPDDTPVPYASVGGPRAPPTHDPYRYDYLYDDPSVPTST